MANFSPNDPGYRGQPSSVAAQFGQSEGLGSPASVNTGMPASSGPDINGVLVYETNQDGVGGKKWITPTDVGATSAQEWANARRSIYGNQYSQNERQLQLENYERYVVATGNGTEARLMYDKDGKNGYSANYNSGIFVDGDSNNVALRAFGTNEYLAKSYFNENPDKVGTLTIPEAAKLYLDSKGITSSADELAKARADWNKGSGGGGGRITTVSRTEELTGQQLRGRGNQTALNTMGRTLGVGEADEVVKGLNRESRKNPEVTTGYGTGNQKTKGGYDFAQGLQDVLADTADGEAYQKVTRGINLLGRALGSVQ